MLALGTNASILAFIDGDASQEEHNHPGTTEEILVPILERENRESLKAARSQTAGEKTFHVAFSPDR